jgi:lipopolysaccharide biosynthesis glycosyltransferase
VSADFHDNGSNVVPVVYATDDEFARPAYISMYSLLTKGAKNRKFEIVIMLPGDISSGNKQMFQSLQDKFHNCTIRILDMGYMYRNVAIKMSRIRYVTFYRLNIAQMLPEHNKCIYMDADTLIDRDIAELYDIDMGSNWVAGVLDAGFLDYDRVKKSKEMNIPNMDKYINAGILLLNTKAIREEDLTSKLVKAIDKNYYLLDQDIINAVLYPNILNVPLKYNTMVHLLKNQKYDLKKYYSQEELDEAMNQPVVIHFVGYNKPWKNVNAFGSEKWRRYQRMLDVR